MNKKQFESFHSIKEVNSFLKKNNSPTKIIAEKNTWGDYQIKFDCEAGNLPDKLKEIRHAKELYELFHKQKRELQTLLFYKD